MWNAATLDPEHDTLYIGTGDNYSDPVSPMSDAIVALKMSTGEILWWHQFTKDAWNSSCYLDDKTIARIPAARISISRNRRFSLRFPPASVP